MPLDKITKAKDELSNLLDEVSLGEVSYEEAGRKLHAYLAYEAYRALAEAEKTIKELKGVTQ
jgi:hypothetical protein